MEDWNALLKLLAVFASKLYSAVRNQSVPFSPVAMRVPEKVLSLLCSPRFYVAIVFLARSPRIKKKETQTTGAELLPVRLLHCCALPDSGRIHAIPQRLRELRRTTRGEVRVGIDTISLSGSRALIYRKIVGARSRTDRRQI